jgi:transcriptional regulator with XRE-family HTH domain
MADTRWKRFGIWFRQQRNAAKMNQTELARRSGMSRQHISDIENGETGIKYGTAATLALALGIHPRDVVTQAGFLFEEDPALMVREVAVDIYDPNSDAPTEDEEGEVLRYFQGIPPMMRPAAKAMLKSLVDAEPDYEEGKVYGKKAE